MTAYEDVANRAAEIRPMLEKFFTGEIGPMFHQPYGHGNMVYVIPDHLPPLVVKTSDHPDAFTHTKENIRVLSELQIPTPRVVAEDHGHALAILVMEYIPGRDLGHELSDMTLEQRHVLASQIVEIQRRVGKLPVGGGFGWAPIGVTAPFDKWVDIVERDLAGLPEPYKSRLAALHEGEKTYLARIPALPFLDDLTVKNVIIDGGQLRGIVDLDNICYGDPLYWLALTETTVMLDVGEEGMDYGSQLRRLWMTDRQSERVLALYEGIFTAQFLSRDLAVDPRKRMERFFETRVGPFENGYF